MVVLERQRIPRKGVIIRTYENHYFSGKEDE